MSEESLGEVIERAQRRFGKVPNDPLWRRAWDRVNDADWLFGAAAVCWSLCAFFMALSFFFGMMGR